MHNGACGHQDCGRVGGVPYQALPLLRFFTYKIHMCEKVRKGEGELGDEAKSTTSAGLLIYLVMQ